MGPPKALDWPNPMSSINTISTLGASAGALTSKRGGGVAFRTSKTVLCGYCGSGIGSTVRSVGNTTFAAAAGVCALTESVKHTEVASATSIEIAGSTLELRTNTVSPWMFRLPVSKNHDLRQRYSRVHILDGYPSTVAANSREIAAVPDSRCLEVCVFSEVASPPKRPVER